MVPIKPIAARKTRLQGHLTPDQIAALTEQMLRHVLDVLARVEGIGAITLLAAENHAGWSGQRFPDPGAGLNAALAAAARAVPERLVILHADLPAVSPADVAALLAAAGRGSAIAPDRRGTGTNALALADARGFDFAFGADSFMRHRSALLGCGVVRRPGLALDIDLAEDLDLAIADGHLRAIEFSSQQR